MTDQSFDAWFSPIFLAACERHHVDPDLAMYPGRFKSRSYIDLRRELIATLRSCGYSWPEIGRALGYTQHTGPMYLHRKTLAAGGSEC